MSSSQILHQCSLFNSFWSLHLILHAIQTSIVFYAPVIFFLNTAHKAMEKVLGKALFPLESNFQDSAWDWLAFCTCAQFKYGLEEEGGAAVTCQALVEIIVYFKLDYVHFHQWSSTNDIKIRCKSPPSQNYLLLFVYTYAFWLCVHPFCLVWKGKTGDLGAPGPPGPPGPEVSITNMLIDLHQASVVTWKFW